MCTLRERDYSYWVGNESRTRDNNDCNDSQKIVDVVGQATVVYSIQTCCRVVQEAGQ